MLLAEDTVKACMENGRLFRSGDRKMRRCFASPMSLQHGDVGRFNMLDQASGIEERAGIALPFEFILD